jgi:hypothetical protein
MMSSFTLASADVVKASAQPDYRPAGIGVREADPLVAISAPRAEASRPVQRILRLKAVAGVSRRRFTLAFVVLVVLAIANLGGAASWTADVSKIGGWVTIADGFAAGYLGATIVLNVTLSRELLPMWPARSRPKT